MEDVLPPHSVAGKEASSRESAGDGGGGGTGPSGVGVKAA